MLSLTQQKCLDFLSKISVFAAMNSWAFATVSWKTPGFVTTTRVKNIQFCLYEHSWRRAKVLLETPGVVGTNMTGNGPASCQKYLVLLPERQMETSQGLVEKHLLLSPRTQPETSRGFHWKHPVLSPNSLEVSLKISNCMYDTCRL